MKKIILFACILWFCCLTASPVPYEKTAADVQTYLVESIAKYILEKCTIGLLIDRVDDDLSDEVIPWYITFELGLARFRCLEILKGDASIADYSFCFLYSTPRENLEFGYVSGERAEITTYRWRGKTYNCRGKEVWQFAPPYDPFRYDRDEFVRLMFLTPERKLDTSRIRLSRHRYTRRTIAKVVKGDVKRMPSEEVMRQLGVEGVFSNRVFRLNEGGVFQVDYDDPHLKGRMLDAAVLKCLGYAREVNGLVHLSAAEVSEVVYLAYAADGDRDGAAYAAAVRRCPGILRPFAPPFRTELGRRVDAALRDGTRLPEAKPLRRGL